MPLRDELRPRAVECLVPVQRIACQQRHDAQSNGCEENSER